MEIGQIKELSEILNNARDKVQGTEQLSKLYQMTAKDAYQVQELGIAYRQKNGEKLVGLKMGLTSKAKREQMNLHSPLYGELTDVMQLTPKASTSLLPFIHPKIEPEVAYLVSEELSGRPTRQEVENACSAACVAMEILDSRYTEFKYFSFEDVVSDNSSSCLFVLGPWHEDFREIDMANLDLKIKVNGKEEYKGNTKAISGDPLMSVVELVHLLDKNQRSLPAGSIVLAGAATAAIPLKSGMLVETMIDKLGSVELSFS